MTERMAKYNTVVYPMNRHSGYGKPVTVFAESPQQAINRAVDIGWSRFASDARVLIKSVEDLDPRECPHAPVADQKDRNDG